MKQPILSLVLRGVAVGMSVAVVVLNILRTTSSQTLITLLGIGLFALALDALDRGKA